MAVRHLAWTLDPLRFHSWLADETCVGGRLVNDKLKQAARNVLFAHFENDRDYFRAIGRDEAGLPDVEVLSPTEEFMESAPADWYQICAARFMNPAPRLRWGLMDVCLDYLHLTADASPGSGYPLETMVRDTAPPCLQEIRESLGLTRGCFSAEDRQLWLARLDVNVDQFRHPPDDLVEKVAATRFWTREESRFRIGDEFDRARQMFESELAGGTSLLVITDW